MLCRVLLIPGDDQNMASYLFYFLCRLENTPKVQDLVSAWKADAQLPPEPSEGGKESKGSHLAHQIPGFENMKSLKEIFKAAKSVRDMSTRQERQAAKDAAADAARLAVADAAFTRKAQEAKRLQAKSSDDIAALSPAGDGSTAFSLTAIGEDVQLEDDAFAQEGGSQGIEDGIVNAGTLHAVETFSLAAYIHDSADDHVDVSLPDISTDTTLGDIVEHDSNLPSVGVTFQDVEDETKDEKALKLQPAKEALRRSQSRQRLLLEYVHKIELAQISRGLDARMLFKNIDTDSDGLLNQHDLRRGLRALQISIDDRCAVAVDHYVAIVVVQLL